MHRSSNTKEATDKTASVAANLVLARAAMCIGSGVVPTQAAIRTVITKGESCCTAGANAAMLPILPVNMARYISPACVSVSARKMTNAHTTANTE